MLLCKRSFTLYLHRDQNLYVNPQDQPVRLWMKPYCVTIQMKAIEQYFHVILFIMLFKLVLTFQSVDETLVCDHSNESY